MFLGVRIGVIMPSGRSGKTGLVAECMPGDACPEF